MSLLPSGTLGSLNDPFYLQTTNSGNTLSSPVIVDSTGNAALRITCGPTGQVSISPNGGGDSSVSMDLSNNGDVNPAVLSVKTNPGTNGGYVVVGNPVGGSTISIAGNPAAGACVIQGGNACTGIDIGANNVNFDNIAITPNVTVIKGLGGNPSVLLATGTYAANSTTPVPLPPSAGLWAIVGCSDPGSAPTAYSRQAQLSAMAYVNNSGVVNMGGSGYVDVGGVGGTDFVTLQVNPTATELNLINNSAQSLVGYSIRAFNISGPIPGTL